MVQMPIQLPTPLAHCTTNSFSGKGIFVCLFVGLFVCWGVCWVVMVLCCLFVGGVCLFVCWDVCVVLCNK